MAKLQNPMLTYVDFFTDRCTSEFMKKIMSTFFSPLDVTNAKTRLMVMF